MLTDTVIRDHLNLQIITNDLRIEALSKFPYNKNFNCEIMLLEKHNDVIRARLGDIG